MQYKLLRTSEDQIHIVTVCKYSADGPKNVVKYEDLFKNNMKQKKSYRSTFENWAKKTVN